MGLIIAKPGAVAPVSPPSTANVTSIQASTSSVTLLSASSVRLGATIYNNSSNGDLYIKFGVSATTGSFTTKMTPGAYYELPFGYTGRVDGIWTTNLGSGSITELTQ